MTEHCDKSLFVVEPVVGVGGLEASQSYAQPGIHIGLSCKCMFWVSFREPSTELYDFTAKTEQAEGINVAST